MNAFIELGLAVVDLAKAEIAECRARAVRLIVALGAVIAGAVVLVLGVVRLLNALSLALSPPLGPAWAEAVTGVAALVAAGVILWLGSSYARN